MIHHNKKLKMSDNNSSFISPSGITYNADPIVLIECKEKPDDFDSIMDLYGKIIPKDQRCPQVAVDDILIWIDDNGHKFIAIGLFDKTKPTIYGSKRIVGAVMTGGHVEVKTNNGEKPDFNITSAVMKEIREEFNVTEFINPPTPIIEYAYMEADPRNRYITHVFISATFQKPTPSNELTKIALVPFDDLVKIIKNDGEVNFGNEKHKFILGHRDKLYCALKLGASITGEKIEF